MIYAGGGILKSGASDGAARARGADGHPRRDDPHGPRLVPRQPPALPRHAGDARQLHGRHRHAAGRPAGRPRQPLRRPRDRARSRRSPRRRRWSTSTSTRPRSARSGVPRSGSSPTAAWRSRRSSRSSGQQGRSITSRLAPWMATLDRWQAEFPYTYDRSEPDHAESCPARSGRRPTLKPQFVIERLRASTPPDTILVSGVGQHQMWASQYWASSTRTPGSTRAASGPWASPCRPPSGPRSGARTAMVWAVDGDGCFQMTAQELVTASAERIPVKIAILNNAYLGMVRQWQHMFYEERYSEVYLSPDLPDYVGWAESMGCVGLRVESPEEVAARHREGERHRRPAGRDRLPHRLDGAGLPDGDAPGPPTTTSSSTPPSATCGPRPRRELRSQARRAPPPPALGARREQGGRARPCRGPVLAPRLQHLLPGGRTDRRRSVLPDLDRRRRRVLAARAGRGPARQAHQRRRDQRAPPRRGPRGRAAARERLGRRRPALAGHPARRRLRRPHRRRRLRRPHRHGRRDARRPRRLREAHGALWDRRAATDRPDRAP